MQRPFRFGIVNGRAESRSEWTEKARRTEDLGYATFLVPDRFVTSVATSVGLAIAAEATKTLRIGSFVFCNDYRHPAVLAKEVATLDLLTEGRFELGIGPGSWIDDYQQTGIPFDEAGMRVSRFFEATHILKALFAEEPVNFSGKYYTITNLNGLPKPVQKPHPPIFIGGSGKRMLSFAAREADIVGIAPSSATGEGNIRSAGATNLASATTEPTLQKIAWVREAAGDRFSQIELSCTVFAVIITEQREQVAQQVGSRSDMSAEQVLDAFPFLIGTHDQIAETLLERRERYGISYIQTLEDNREKLAPVVARLAGK